MTSQVEKRERGADWSMGRGEARGSTHQGGAGDQKAQRGSEQLIGATKKRAEGLKGASGGGRGTEWHCQKRREPDLKTHG